MNKTVETEVLTAEALLAKLLNNGNDVNVIQLYMSIFYLLT